MLRIRDGARVISSFGNSLRTQGISEAEHQIGRPMSMSPAVDRLLNRGNCLRVSSVMERQRAFDAVQGPHIVITQRGCALLFLKRSGPIAACILVILLRKRNRCQVSGYDSNTRGVSQLFVDTARLLIEPLRRILVPQRDFQGCQIGNCRRVSSPRRRNRSQLFQLRFRSTALPYQTSHAVQGTRRLGRFLGKSSLDVL